MDEKRCTFCRTAKPVTEFAKHRGSRDGLQAYCRPCSLQKAREWAEKNKGKKLEHKRASRARDPARARANNRRHYANHADRLREESRNRSPERRAKRAEAQRRYRMENPEKIRQLNRARVATQRAAVGKVSRKGIERLIALQKGKCAACRKPTVQNGKGFHLDHRQPLAAGGTNEFHNLQLLCPACNIAKSARDPVEFMQSRGFLL